MAEGIDPGKLLMNAQLDLSETVTDPGSLSARTRQRGLTEKGRVFHLQQLKSRKVTALSAVTRKKNKLCSLMLSNDNLTDVKTEYDNYCDLINRYKESYLTLYEAVDKDSKKETTTAVS